MCYVCSCFGWVLDFIQRVVTFVLACWMSFAVIMGLLVAIVAGIAYGYNYSMAEFLTFTRSDVTVYMRRGQFYDQPDVRPQSFRRSGGDEEPFPDTNPNAAVEGDYEMKNPQGEVGPPLRDAWLETRDSRKYAQKLTKYNPVFSGGTDKNYREQAVQAEMTEEPIVHIKDKLMSPNPLEYYRMTSSPSRRNPQPISNPPNVLLSTAVYQSGSSKIIMRNFHVSTMKSVDMDKNVEMDEYEERRHMAELYMSRMRNIDGEPTNTPGVGFDSGDVTRTTRAVPLRHWGPTTTPVFQDYSDEVDEDNVLYKPG